MFSRFGKPFTFERYRKTWKASNFENNENESQNSILWSTGNVGNIIINNRKQVSLKRLNKTCAPTNLNFGINVWLP